MAESMLAAANRVREVRRDAGNVIGENDIIDVPTSFDGSWSSRGHTARDAVVTGIAEETGQIVDAVFYSSGCPTCTSLNTACEDGRLSYLEYYQKMAEHETSCLLNHTGSAKV